MKKLLPLILCLLLSLNSFSQNLAPIGATWQYRYDGSTGNPWEGGILRFVSLKDTIINGTQYKWISIFGLSKTGDAKTAGNYYFNDSNGIVFYYKNGTKNLFFDFNKIMGDTVEIDAYAGITSQISKNLIVIDSTYMPKSGLKEVYFHKVGATFQNKISQRFFRDFFFADFYLDILTEYFTIEGWSSLNCYKDSEFELKFTQGDCESLPYHKFGSLNAQWYVSKWKPGLESPGYFYRLKVEGDTLLAGKNARVINYYHNGTVYEPNVNLIVYDEAKKVFVWNKTHFSLLYDFNAKPGDTIRTEPVYIPEMMVDANTSPPDSNSYYYIIDSVEEVNFSGARLIRQKVSYPGSWMGSKYIYECLGGTTSMIGWSIIILPAGYGGFVRCFFNPETGFYYYVDEFKPPLCDKITSVNEIETNISFRIFPNPGNGIFKIEGLKLKPLSVEVYDVTGKQVYIVNSPEVLIDFTINIDFTSFDSGIYFVIIKTENRVNYSKLLIE